MSEAPQNFLFTSESVTEGHPDKVCDQIADAILDEILRKEASLEAQGFADEHGPARVKNVRCACEALVTRGFLMLAGEIRTQAYVDVKQIARDVIADIGYTNPHEGFDAHSCGILNEIHGQSPDIALGVDCAEAVRGDEGADPYDVIGAGDQGIMFGYASDETDVLMPMSAYLAQRMSERLTQVRKSGRLEYLRPDGKTQVTLEYKGGRPSAVKSVVVSSQHADSVSLENLRGDIRREVIDPVLEECGIALAPDADVYINPTGRFVVGGPAGDTGVTGRKLIVDTYGGVARHGGGAFSGKDPTKVDRSASYAARWVAKNIVASGLAKRCEVQFSYAIGVARPISIYVNTFGTGQMEDSEICKLVEETFDLRPAAIQDTLKLWRPIYRQTSNYGHFGRELPDFEWEKTNALNQ